MNKLIPKINISELLENGFNSKKSSMIIKQIEKACLDVGFFEIQGHGIHPKIINSTLKTCKNFFNLPLKKKLRLATKKWNKIGKNQQKITKQAIRVAHKKNYSRKSQKSRFYRKK